MTRITYDALVPFVRGVLTGAGLDDFSNDAVTTGLCETSLRGVDSHGIRLLAHYANSAVTGRKNPRPNFMFTRNLPSVGLLDADDAFGHAAGMKAIDHAIEMAGETGIGAVGVANSSHPGAMASFALKAARQGFIGFAFTHADSLLLPPNGTRPFFGTNPVCMAAPRREADPYCLDMATSVIPWNRLRIHQDSGEPLPEGVAADAQGYGTEDPHAVACLMPVGSPIAGYKGHALASMVEVLCAAFTGMAFGRDIPAMYKAPMEQPRMLGQFFMVMRTDGCISSDAFLDAMQRMAEDIRAEPAHPGHKVMLPGDREIETARKRKVEGIPLDEATVDALRNLAGKYDVELTLQ